MVTPDRKVRKLMEEYQKTGEVSKAALRADLDPKTARKYIKAGKMPSEMAVERDWRTRLDPFSEHWDQCCGMLEDAPELEGKFLFEWLCDAYPGVYKPGQLRTFQRRVREWRALHGPDKEVFFPQVHNPGVRMSTDFTRMGHLEITIQGEAFSHMLCHCVLTYSNWEWATICHSESLLALRGGIQAALFRLGRVPVEHWTDHSTAATHRPGEEVKERRAYNEKYLDVMEHFGMKPRTIQVDEPHENGDVESLNGALKRRIEQHLLLRGSRDFESVETYEVFLAGILQKVNQARSTRVSEELARMRVLDVRRLAEYSEYDCTVRTWSTISVDRRIYSVPSRLIGQRVKVQRYEDRIEVYYKGVHQLTAPWIARDRDHAINYRHVIGWLVRKPGAFRQYRFREDLFPTEAFRWAHEQLSESLEARTADREYLQILHHAAQTMECEMDATLTTLRREQLVPRLDTVLERCRPQRCELPALEPFDVRLPEYDELLEQVRVPA